MNMVALYTSPYFTGVITNTPSGTSYNVRPGQTILAAQVDVALLLTFDFTLAFSVPITVTDGTTTVAAVGVVSFTSGATVTDEGNGTAGVDITGGGGGTRLTIEDDSGHTITSVGTLTFEGVAVSGSTPSAITNMTTITAPSGVGTAAGTGIQLEAGSAGPTATAAVGGNIQLYAGPGGVGTASTYGGRITGRGGAGGSGTVTAAGGGLLFTGGVGGPVGDGAGGYAQFSGGPGYGTGAGGSAAFFGGLGSGSGPGGDVFGEAGNAAGGGSGGNVRLQTGTGSPPGTMQVNNDPSLLVAFYSWVAGAQLNNQTIFTTTREMQVTAVIGRPDIVNGSAATLVIVKAASGTAPAGGTALTSTSMDLTGTANTNQTLTLSATLADITLAAGDSLCMVTTGVLAASAGCITIWGTPQ